MASDLEVLISAKEAFLYLGLRKLGFERYILETFLKRLYNMGSQ